MRLRTILLPVTGFLVGYQLGKRSMEDDPNVLKGPRDGQRAGRSASGFVSAQAQRLADQATKTSVAAIRRTRTAIQERLERYDADDVSWN